MSCRHGKKISILLLSIFILNIIFIFNIDVARADSSNVVTIYPNGKSKNIINRMFNLNNDNDDSLVIGDTRLTYDVDYDNNNIDINFEDEIFIDDVVSEGDTIHNAIRFNDDEFIEVGKQLKTEGFMAPSVKNISLSYEDVSNVESVTLMADSTTSNDWIGLVDKVGLVDYKDCDEFFDNDVNTFVKFILGEKEKKVFGPFYFNDSVYVNFFKLKLSSLANIVDVMVKFYLDGKFVSSVNINNLEDYHLDCYIDSFELHFYHRSSTNRRYVYMNEIEFFDELILYPSLDVFNTSYNDRVEFGFDIKDLNDDVFKINIYRDGELIVENYEELSYIDEGLYYSTSYDYRFELIVNDEIVDTVDKTIVTLDRDQPVLNVTDLTGYYDVLMNFKIDNLLKDDVYKFNIYRDDELIAENYEELTYKDEDLEVDTDYEYYIELIINDEIVDTQRFVSRTKYIDIVPPEIPSGLTADVGNGFSALKWNHVDDDDLAGYNIYLNGEKINIDLVKTNKYVMYGLENDIEYSVSVSAVDDEGNESERSEEYVFICDSEGMPLVYVGVNVKDVSDGVSSIFGDLWPLIAFLVAVPIAFYVSRGIKQLLV